VSLPATVELCARPREGQPCLGVVSRGQPDRPYCFRCGAQDAGVLYRLVVPVDESAWGRLVAWLGGLRRARGRTGVRVG
jgi:hypothetical protein